MMRTRSLVDIDVGQKAVVRQFAGGPAFTRRIETMGIRLGTKLIKTSGSRLGGPVTVRAGNIQLAIGHGMASKIVVEVEADVGSNGHA